MDHMMYNCDYPYYQVPPHAPYAVAFTQVTPQNGEFCPCYEAKDSAGFKPNKETNLVDFDTVIHA